VEAKVFKISKIFAILVVIGLVLSFLPGCSKITLSATSNPTGGGTISGASGTYENGVVVSVKAIPNNGYRFDHWEGGMSGTAANIQVTMTGSKNLVAFFTKTYTLSTSTNPAGAGSIGPAMGTYDEGSTVTLIASPNQYYQFNGWAGDVSGNSDHITITMTSNKNVIASFNKLSYSIQSQVQPLGAGMVDPSGGTFEAGTQKTITATPATGYRFDHWGGSISGTANSLNLMMDSNKNVIAYFTKVNNLTISTPPNVGASVKGSGSYDAGTKVTITAKATVCPYAFDHWSGTDNDNIDPTTVTMSADKSVTVSFKQLTAGQPVTKNNHVTSNATESISIALNQYEWVSGQAVGGDCHAYIKSPDGSTLKDLGLITATTDFSFNADIAGNYIIVVVSGGNTLGFYDYSVTYTVYH
jgi:hypothetical protein